MKCWKVLTKQRYLISNGAYWAKVLNKGTYQAKALTRYLIRKGTYKVLNKKRYKVLNKQRYLISKGITKQRHLLSKGTKQRYLLSTELWGADQQEIATREMYTFSIMRIQKGKKRLHIPHDILLENVETHHIPICKYISWIKTFSSLMANYSKLKTL